MFNALRYLKAHHIPYAEEGPDLSAGWIGISCPFCRDHMTHGGFSPEGFYSCWRCGWHSLEDVIMRLERIPFHVACQRVAEYQTQNKRPRRALQNRSHRVSQVEVPGQKPLKEIHKRYLRDRGFDPDYLEQKYDLRGTGPVGPYRFRIIAPIYIDAEVISYQGRDVTNRAELPYKACPKEQEIVEHKNVLYNIDNAQEACIVVEGIFDVWRLGDGTVATFGTGFRWSQVLMLVERFHRVFLLYDGEPKAQARARKIVQALAKLGVETENILLSKGDPAELTPEMARRLKGELCLNY